MLGFCVPAEESVEDTLIPVGSLALVEEADKSARVPAEFLWPAGGKVAAEALEVEELFW